MSAHPSIVCTRTGLGRKHLANKTELATSIFRWHLISAKKLPKLMVFWTIKQRQPIADCLSLIRKVFLRYQVVTDMNVGRSVDETLRIIQAFQFSGLCPAKWKPG